MARKNVLGQTSAFSDEQETGDNPFALSLEEFNPHLKAPGFKPANPEIQQLRERVLELESQIETQGGASALSFSSGVIDLGLFRLTPIGLQIADTATVSDVEVIGEILFRLQSSIQWLIGDWLNAMGYTSEADIQSVAAQYGRSFRTLQNWKYTSSAIAYDLRQADLDYNHHVLVTKLSADLQFDWLRKAVQGDLLPGTDTRRRWSVARLRSEIAGIAALPAPVKKQQQREAKRAFTRVWQAINTDAIPNYDDIALLEKWLVELKKRAKS